MALATFRRMVFEVGMTVRLKVRIGWVQGVISGQVFDFECWYITTQPGSTYVASGHQLRLVTKALITEPSTPSTPAYHRRR